MGRGEVVARAVPLFSRRLLSQAATESAAARGNRPHEEGVHGWPPGTRGRVTATLLGWYRHLLGWYRPSHVLVLMP